MRTIFVEDHTTLMSWLDMLECFDAAGHDVAAFVLSLVLYRSNSDAVNDNIARQWLRKVEGDEVGPVANVTWKNEICTRHLQLAMFVLEDLARRSAPGQSIVLCLLWPCWCVARTYISAEAKAVASMQDGKVGRSELCSIARSVGSAMSVIGSSNQCGRFCADQC
jgi:hypothetical protein